MNKEKPLTLFSQVPDFQVTTRCLKFNGIFASWNGSPGPDVETNISNLQSQSFENVSFSK